MPSRSHSGAEAGVTTETTLMIGDSDVDVMAARNARVWSMGCSYGLSPHTLAIFPPDCPVDSPADWPLAWPAKARNS